MYGIRQCNRIFLSGEIGAFFTEIFFQISVVILNSNLHYQIFKFVIDNSDITSLNCLQHIQKRRNFDAKVTCHQPICLLLHAILTSLLLWVYCPTFRKEPTGQVCGAQMLLAQGEKELILVALLKDKVTEMVMSCSLEDSFFLDLSGVGVD